ncbi:uncharacterized protein METZ01_LOCUS35650 [marine metagenome]|jgi:4-hydroxy-3-polyprenylbenzoate decarboxylase|uniref:UbiD family decarboxylase n=1 Tax=marine metagenome TaxID=408172 RepID=A0A381QTR5_9ZZZZ|tara:strand:+ start:219 stop:1694 length:1476 start_codon:yes stop_codon:yes gene_type:complete
MIGPFDSLRDYIAALDSKGLLVRIPKMDQDKYEATGFAYQLVKEFGYDLAPAFLIEEIKVNNQWMKGPVLGNIFGGWSSEALMYGIENLGENQKIARQKTSDHLEALYRKLNQWPKIPPIEITSDGCPCKENILLGDDVDVTKFPWLHTNPADAGQYLNAAMIFIEDPDLGRNVAPYRCQIKEKDKIGVNAEIQQNAWNFLMKMKKQGKKVAPIAVVNGVDPITFTLGASKLAQLGEDELDFVGGFRNKAVELVKCETNNILVPANCEIVLEGEVPLDAMEKEGPYGEMYGFMGLEKEQNFFMNIKAITHRDNPWIVNSFAGVTKISPSILQTVVNLIDYKEAIPSLLDIYRPAESTGVLIVSIDKQNSGEGMATGKILAEKDFFGKVIIIVDRDIDVYDKGEIFQALGTRWQPHPAAEIIEETRGMPLDASAPKRFQTSKIIIDATRQFSEEGGPNIWPEISKVMLEKLSPETFDLIEQNWENYFIHWKR